MGTAFVNASALSDWRGMLSQRGLDTGKLDQLIRIPTLMSQEYGNQVISLKDFVKAVEYIGARNSNANLSWTVGLASNYALRGRAGRAVLGARTLGSAFSRLVQYYPLIQDRTLVNLEIDEQWASISYRILDPDIWPRTEDALYTLGIFASLIKAAAPEAWSGVEIHIEAEAEFVQKDLDNIVKANVYYGAETNGLRFPTQFLSRELNLLSPVDKSYINQLNRLLREKNSHLPMRERTSQAIFQSLSQGKVNQDHIAIRLGVSRRTLRRKLAAEDTSFQVILDECRMRAASLEFQISPKQSLSEMALKLGYSEHSTFSRAFMRWAGMAPQKFRKIH